MSDAELRDLERRFGDTGSAEDELAWLEARTRAGEAAVPFEWTQSSGGPVLAIEEAGLPFWEGATNEDDPTDPETDYGRACECESPRLEVGPALGLVLPGPYGVGGWAFRDDLVLLKEEYTSAEGPARLARWVCEHLRVARSQPDHLDLAGPAFDYLLTEDTSMCVFDSVFAGAEAKAPPNHMDPPFRLPCRAGIFKVYPVQFSEAWGEAYVYFLVRLRRVALSVPEAIGVAKASVTRRAKKKRVVAGVSLQMESANGLFKPAYRVHFTGGAGISAVEDAGFFVDVDCATGKAGKRIRCW